MTKFSDLNLNPKVLKAVAEAGYESPTPIQAGAIPPALEGRDVLGIAQTGTGKTAGFVLPMLSLLARGRARARMPRSLVLCPTRELAAQVAENFDTYSKHLKLTKALLIGGVSFKEQDKLIDKGVDVLICTPGRLLDHFERGKLLLTGVQVMVVDEADRMLDMGFIPDIERIFSLTPFTRQTLFFSATMAPEIERITNTFLSAPARVEVARQATASETIEQSVVIFKASRKDREGTEKRNLLRAMIDAEGEKCSNAIIFCNRKMDVDTVAKSLKKHGYDAAPIHGDLDQSQRTRTLDGFREGNLRFLVASDVAARGLDVPAVSHVFNFDVPSHAEDYVHRIGRTGRAGRDGKAMMICIPRDEKNLDAIETLIQKAIPRLDNPLGGGAPASAEAAAPAEDEKPAKPRRTRSRRKPDEAAPATEEVPTQAAELSETPPATEPAEAPAPAKDIQAAPSEGTQDRAPREDKPRSRGGRGGRGRSGGGGGGGGDNNRVVGLGDHMPSFIAMSFEERRDS
ncbi:DEAD/DEAH box helicase [Roseovarius sp. LXJ103]|uniref:DEAD/DEAH box helicase n=1 Tax=Roseovarius carneus TaxID=2853164 RepID=UPI000D615CF9|nr:DEAD/DEAH box helicase [Roseovarius carneus]MBZ8119622.1 DEAD/DEAH box helicase [Roseovarius carneus]PWE34762.1 DEAD/DEAH box helicase [Pelagicola sp. LXJ1103]